MKTTPADDQYSRDGATMPAGSRGRVLASRVLRLRGNPLWPASPEAQVRRIPILMLVLLCGTLALTSSTVNWQRLHDASRNRYYTDIFQHWNRIGFLRSFGLWLKVDAPTSFQLQSQEPRLYAYGHASTGFILPAYLMDRIIVSIRGRSSVFAVQLYSQVVVLMTAFVLGLLSLRVATRRGVEPAVAGTFAASAALVYQNFLHHLAMAQEILATAVSMLLVGIILLLRDVAWDGDERTRRRIRLAISAAMFWMALSDLVIVPAFFAIAVGLLSFYGVGERLTLVRWLGTYVLPIIIAFLLFQAQLALGRAILHVEAIGTPELVRMGLRGRDVSGLGGHVMILTFMRERWAWWGFGSLALMTLVAVLFAYRNPQDHQGARDLMHILPAPLTYILLASMFSELVLIHPYIYDMLLILASVLLVCVHGPLLLTRVYPRHGLIALAVLMFSTLYVWISIVDYAISLQA